MTDAERLLWRRLRNRQLEGVKFRNQEPVEAFIVDFVSYEKRLVIELDGGQHATAAEANEQRDQCLSRNGFKILRFWNNDVMKNIDGVLETIRQHVVAASPSPSPPPARGGAR